MQELEKHSSTIKGIWEAIELWYFPREDTHVMGFLLLVTLLDSTEQDNTSSSSWSWAQTLTSALYKGRGTEDKASELGTKPSGEKPPKSRQDQGVCGSVDMCRCVCVCVFVHLHKWIGPQNNIINFDFDIVQ